MTSAPVPPHPGVRVPPPLIFVAGFLLAWAVQRARPAALLTAPLRGLAVGFGWMVIAGSATFMVWAALTFLRARTAIVPMRPATVLVRTGPFARTRNPMYLGLTLMYLGATALVNSVWPLVLLPVVLLVLRRAVINREERYLQGAFGAEYTEYCRRVRRWL